MTDQESIELEGEEYYEQKLEEHSEMVGCLAILFVALLATGVVFYVSGLVKSWFGG